jgi:hypothetical protein
MNDLRKGGPPRLEFDLDGFAKAERLVANEVGNALLMLNLELQQHFKMRAEEYQVYLLIVMTSVTRFVRTASPDDPYVDRTPLPMGQFGTISRRRIADVLGIPVETVRRVVNGLLAEGLLVEHSRGRLSTQTGVLQGMSQDKTHEKIVRRLITSVNTMIRLGAIEALPKE